MGVAPVIGILGVAGPLGGDSDPAGHPDLAVGDQDPAVGAVGDPLDRVRLQRPKQDHIHPCDTHLLDQRALHLHGAERVEDHLAGDALAGLVADRGGDLAGDLAAPVDVGLHVQPPLRGGDRLQEGGEDAVAVDQQLGLVALGDRRSGERLGGAQEVLGGHVQVGVEVVPEGALTAVAEAVGGVPAERRGRGQRGQPVAAPALLQGGGRPMQTRWFELQVAGQAHQPSTSSKVRGSIVNRKPAPSISSPSTLKPVTPSVSTTTSRPLQLIAPLCPSILPLRRP